MRKTWRSFFLRSDKKNRMDDHDGHHDDGHHDDGHRDGHGTAGPVGSVGGAKRRHKSVDVSMLSKSDVKRLLMRTGGIIEDLKALALSKGIKSYVKKEDLVDGILRKTRLDELKRFVGKHAL